MTLRQLFSEIADAIRRKTGKEESIKAENFSEEIGKIPTADDIEEKTVRSSNVEQTIYPSEGKLINKINVEPIELENKSITITENGTQTISADEGYDGLDEVSIVTNVPQLDTSDATATAEDIAEGKTAYVDGEKITGTQEAGADLSEYFDNTISAGSSGIYCGLQRIIKKIPDDIVISGTNCSYMFYYCDLLESIPLLDTSNVINMTRMLSLCTGLISVPQFNTRNVTSMSNMCAGCNKLVTVPILDTSNISGTGMQNIFSGCSSLSNESLNNILMMCINATRVFSNKTLKYIGLSSTQATTCQTLSNWEAFVAAGWTTGY